MSLVAGLYKKWHGMIVTRPNVELVVDDQLEEGLAVEMYGGRRRRTVSRQIGFLAEWRNDMPKVGKKHFPYTEKGKKDANKYAKMTGKKVASRLKKAR